MATGTVDAGIQEAKQLEERRASLLDRVSYCKEVLNRTVNMNPEMRADIDYTIMRMYTGLDKLVLVGTTAERELQVLYVEGILDATEQVLAKVEANLQVRQPSPE